MLYFKAPFVNLMLETIQIIWTIKCRNKLYEYWCSSPSTGAKMLFLHVSMVFCPKTLQTLVPVSHRRLSDALKKICVIVNYFPAECLLTTRCRTNFKDRVICVSLKWNASIFSFRGSPSCALQMKALQWPNQWRTILNWLLLWQIMTLIS